METGHWKWGFEGYAHLGSDLVPLLPPPEQATAPPSPFPRCHRAELALSCPRNHGRFKFSLNYAPKQPLSP